MLTSPQTKRLINRAIFYTGPHKHICNAQGHKSLHAPNPPPVQERADPAQGMCTNAYVLHAQVLVSTSPPGSCLCKYCVTTTGVYSEDPRKPVPILCTSIGFSPIKMYFRPHKHAFQKKSGNLSRITSNCHVLSCFYSLCPVHVQLIGIALCTCRKAAETSVLMSLTCVLHIWPMLYQITLLGTSVCAHRQRKFPWLTRLPEQLNSK